MTKRQINQDKAKELMQKILKYKMENGITDFELSKRMEVNPSHIFKFKNGSMPRLDVLALMLDVLGLELEIKNKKHSKIRE